MSLDRLRDEAWLGDAVLALYFRRWLLRHAPKKMSDADRQQLFELFVSNQFLASFGEPTQVEAAIGRIFDQEGLAAAFAHIEKSFLASFFRSAKKRGYALPNTKPAGEIEASRNPRVKRNSES
jgi:hypothetical protein